MKRSIIITGLLLAVSLSACNAQDLNTEPDEKTEIAGTNSDENKATKSIAEYIAEHTDQPEDNDTKSEDKADLSEDWKVAFRNCLNNVMIDSEPICDSLENFRFSECRDTACYALEDITGDGIPELFVSSREVGEYLDCAVYQAHEKSYDRILTGFSGYNPDTKLIYAGADYTIDLYEPLDNVVEFIESYTDGDGTWYRSQSETGTDMAPVSNEVGESIRSDLEKARRSFNPGFKPITKENIEDSFGSSRDVTVSDCMAAYKGIIENSRPPYEWYGRGVIGEPVYKYALAKIDDDEIPELIEFCDMGDDTMFIMHTFVDGEPKKYVLYEYPMSYVEGKNIIVTSAPGYFGTYYPEPARCFNLSFWRMTDTELKYLACAVSGERPIYAEGDGTHFHADDVSNTVLLYRDEISGEDVEKMITERDISNSSTEEQMSVIDEGFRSNGIDKELGFLPSDDRPFDFLPYDDVLELVKSQI